ncbi:LysR family transcriptional regulator [Pseudomonas sp. 09C 129]|uniref:LysR family transcriptional regulator n=1 Tax=Pseudomonas sp. 09C 129 TaxID=2054915 RepID=UPI000C6C9CE0|nr:LysR family transcriptional regulator [Pseudomonas sp. 09C 129]AUG05017.1 LysR family transcriptional regulator [Pseudomonas sp. 09C 129]
MEDLRRIDLNLLLTLHALLLERHVTRASVRLHKSQPAVSHALAQLRDHFDDQLLIRRDGKMVLTARAQGLLAPLEQALRHLNDLLGASEFDPGKSTARFRLSLSDYATHRILPSLVRHVRSVASGVDLAISQASRETMMAQLADGELDVALGIFPEYLEGIQVQELFPEHFVSLADLNALPECGSLTLEEWLERPHVMLAMRPDANDEIERVLSQMGVRRRIAVALPHWSAAIKLIAGTDLILTVASWAVSGLDRYPTLRKFDAPLNLPILSYQQAWHIRKDADPANRWIRKAILDCSRNT